MARNSSLSFSPRLAASIFTSRMSAGASRKFKGPLGGDCSRLDRLAVLMYSAWLIVHRRNLQARRQAYSAHESLALAVRANKDEKLCSMSHPTSPTLRPCRVLALSDAGSRDRGRSYPDSGQALPTGCTSRIMNSLVWPLLPQNGDTPHRLRLRIAEAGGRRRLMPCRA